MWDFRDSEELKIENEFMTKGFIISKGETYYLERMKKRLECSFIEFIQQDNLELVDLKDAHNIISKENSNNLRLFILNDILKDSEFNLNYYYAGRSLVNNLCGNELAMQKRPGISINLPNNANDILPIHADTWNGVSPYELNIWIPFVDSNKTMSLYILERDIFSKIKEERDGLLRLSSDELYNELKNELTWIDIKYGDILAFDQSLPHGYCLNQENNTHWSFNCRFKGLHTPYWDKKLGEYFMPITVKTVTKLGLNYSHPSNWL